MSSNNLSLSDPRLEWLSERVCLALGITSEDFRYLLTEPYADRPQKERLMHDLDGPIYTLKKFFGDTVKPGGGIFFFPVLEEVEEEYQEEEAVTGAGDGDEGVGEGGEHTGESDEENSQNKSTAAADSGDAPAAAEPPTTAAEEGGENPQQAEGGEAGEAPREGEGEGEEAPVAQKVIMRWVTKKRTIQKRRVKVTLDFLPEWAHERQQIYFLKQVEGELPSVVSLEKGTDYGLLTGDCLGNLEMILREVYGPLLELELSCVEEGDVHLSDGLRHELKAHMHKFESHISHAHNQVRGEVHLELPDVNVDEHSVDEAAEDYERVTKIEAAVDEWCRHISALIDQEGQKQQEGKGPLAEIEFWRARNTALSGIYEQINMPRVQVLIRVLQKAETSNLPVFTYQFSELSKLHAEAKDNVKFLTTLERHFKNLSNGSFSVILDTLESLMNAIRMVWIISRHYNTDERMVPLMERIAWKIADKVCGEVNIRTLLHRPPEQAKKLIEEAKTVLDHWYNTYMDVRQKIEESGTDHRWQFDRKRLFEQTNYMAKVCQDLVEVTTVLDQFYKFLGPELKAVTGESQGIDDVMLRVQGLIGPLEKVPFDIFDRRYRDSWNAVMVRFRKSVEEIENMTKSFIKQSFQKLRSAEGAFELVQNFRNIQSRESINQQINERYKDILYQYMKELEHYHTLFNLNRDAPPTYKNHPPVAGAIAWARDLYLRAKKPILRFQAHEGLLTSDYGIECKQRYLGFARAVDAYMTKLYQDWEARVQNTATEKLKQPILMSLKDKEAAEAAVRRGDSTRIAATPNPVFRMPPAPYRANFAPELTMIIRESKYLDRLGYQVPEAALNVTLQEDKFHAHVQEMNLMLRYYDSLMGRLSQVEAQLLRRQIASVQKVLRAGFTPLNWNSQRIPSFIEACSKALNEFSGVVSQISKSASMIDEVIAHIEATVLVQDTDFRGPNGEVRPMEVLEFYDLIESKRMARLEQLVQKQKSIESPLIKVEELVAGSNSGCSPVLAGYYQFWEKKMYNAIAKMTITSLASLIVILQGKYLGPICRVCVAINGKDIVFNPPVNDIYKYMTKLGKSMVESSKLFVRWMHGSCLECPPQYAHDDEEPFIFSFLEDISQNPQVVVLKYSLDTHIQKATALMNKYLESWRQYDTVYNLWNPQKKQALDKLCDKSIVVFDALLASYQLLADTVRAQPPEKEIEFLLIDCTQVASGIAAQAEQWKQDYGEVLAHASKAKLDKVMDKILGWQADLEHETKDLVELKFVLQTVATICAHSMDMELQYSDVIERYHTLVRYKIPLPEAEKAEALGMAQRWQQLVVDGKTRDLRLLLVKDQFREVTKQQAVDFQEELKDLRRAFYAKGPGAAGVDLEAGMELVEEYQKLLAACSGKKADLVNAENLFNLPITSYPVLQEVSNELDKLARIYDLFKEQKDFQEGMSAMLWSDLDIAALNNGADELEKKCRKFPKELKENSTYKAVESRIFNFKDSLPLIVRLKNDAMMRRHWQKLMEVTSVKFDVGSSTVTLGNIFAMELHRFTADIEDIVNEAVQELKIENELKRIEKTWRGQSLQLAKYTGKNGQDRGWVLRSADEIKLELEDNTLNLQSMAGSKFVVIFSDQVRYWEKTLNLVSECLDAWFLVQRKWMYLESIFIGAEDIRQQLPEEAKKFDAIDKAFRAIMVNTQKEPNVVSACVNDNRLDVLKSLSERLDRCQKSLSDYLDTKRNAFARFFFISDDELLSVLGSSDPTSIQVHLLKLFDNVKTLYFGRGNKGVMGMESAEGEGFQFKTPTNVEGPVEVWMTLVEEEMKKSLRSITKEGVFHYAKSERAQWLKNVLGMVSLVGSQIWWTWEVEDVFRRVAGGNKYAMKELESKLTKQLNDLVAMVRMKLDKQVRKKVNTLLIIDVHARDIVSDFVRESILHVKEFAWESQLRFYWDRTVDDCVIKQCTGSFRYGYEYMGLNGRLVITPLTDRCYMTITQALTFKLGGAPAGPAGTGKTETTKDLAKSLALPCFVINCGEGLDYKAMGSTFSGLVQVGAWGCFDEFNRINIEVLSVVSAQLKAIQNALIYNRHKCDIGLGKEITVKRVAGFATVGIFITMNPGYAGRTELPDNLKALFRPVTMIVPDLQQICEIMLFSEGFEGAKVLAKKMTVLYKLSREQLSKQYHYDFGLRALKSVLVMAGGLKREYATLSEDVVLMRALRDSNMPKFVFEDVPLFKGLINDLFPGLDCPRVGYDTLKKEVCAELDRNGFHCSDDTIFYDQVDKCIQMYETMIVRHTTMIVGPTGGGKTLVLETLRNARLGAENVVVKMFVVNPKAQPLNELYGVMDPVTRDWTDGILSRLFRELNEPLPPGKENEFRLIIYDGDVDAVWVENMNSVMDDNKLLTLPNGERIRLQPHCAMICETFDLQYASPATISRCGMVWVDPKNLGYKPYYERWVRGRCGDFQKIEPAREGEAKALLDLYDKYVKKCIDYVLSGLVDGEMGEKLRQVIPITNIDMVKQLCSSLDAFLPPAGTEGLERTDMDQVYIFCILWSIGAALLGPSRVKFDLFIRKIALEALPESLLYDWYYDLETHKWDKWMARVPTYTEPSPFKFYNVFVPTTDSVLYTHLLENLAPRKPLLFVGESGTAKTVTIQNYLSSLSPETSAKLNMNFSSRTTSLDVQTNIEANVDKRSGIKYGPPSGKKLVIFIDDMNMPKVDLYGTQQPITLLLFLMGKGTLYDRGKDLNLKVLEDLNYIAAMGPPGGGRNNVDPRFIALFNVYNLTPPTEEVLRHIYTSILTTRLTEFPESVKETAVRFTDATLTLFNTIIERLPPTPSKFHYIFNLRDLSRIYEGLCLATPDKVSKPAQLVRLWRNEGQRIFCDRLTTDVDMAMVNGEMEKIIRDKFADHADFAMAEPMIFGDYELAVRRINEEQEDPRLYQDLGSFARIRKIFDEVLESYNVEYKPMTLVLFEMALEHLTRIMRIIRMPRGHALLVGVGGSGKQSLTKLATFCAGYKLFEMTLIRNYGENEFREDLKKLYGLLGKGEVVFLFTDAHVVEEGFLEFINNMLTTGMVPALFEQDEKDQAINGVRKEVKEKGIVDTADNCWQYFINKCRNNLHIVLAMSPSGERLRIRCRSFPGLVSACVIDWLYPWPADALQKVAEYFLQDESLPGDQRDAIIGHLVHAHMGVVGYAQRFADTLRRFYYVTPKNYLDLIANYRSQLKSNDKKIEQSVKRLDGGLTKLIDAAAAVDRMQIELSEKKIVVDEKTRLVEALIEVIKAKTEVANVRQEEAAKKQEVAAEQSIVIAREKELADSALMEALPAVEAAAQALENLDKADLQEIKVFNTPPPLVQAVCMQVVALNPTNEKLQETWMDAKKMLSNPKLLELLKSYPKDKISEKQIKNVKKYFKDPNLNVDNMASVSKAGKGLLVWVTAITKYYDVARNVEPLRIKVRDMEKAQAKTEKELEELKELLSTLEKELGELNIEFKKANGELSDLQHQAQLMEKRLNAASKLITGLTGERSRWTRDVQNLQMQRGRLYGDCLLAASFLSYAGAFTTDYRAEMIYDKFLADIVARKIPATTPYKLEQLLTSDAVVQGWVARGLPADEHSVQNGILTTKASRFPLCIDPQQQAVTWIKRTYEKENLTVKSLNESDFMKHLELAIQFGNPFLFENIDEELDPMLDPVLEKNVIMEGGAKLIKLGDKMVDWDENFRLFFTTKLANPHYSPEVMGKTMIINYGVTMEGLANQLLNVVVAHERPDLEAQYAALVSEMSENALLIVQLEDTLLKELSSSSGNILDNEDLIATLDSTKTKAVEIQKKLEEAKFTKEEISKARSVYTPVAKRGSILYFAEAGLANVMSMYEISLDSFLGVFNRALDLAKKDVVLENRLRNMSSSITVNIYDYTCTGIFERHKLMFSFQMTCMVMEGDGRLNRPELDFFLKGDTSLDAVKEPCPVEWLMPAQWKNLLRLADYGDHLKALLADFIGNTAVFKEWYDLEMPETTDIPLGHHEKLSTLERLCVMRCFRPDRVYNAVKIFVMQEMGEKYVQPPVLDYARIYKQSSPGMPMVFILSPGADPQNDIQLLGDELGFTGPKFKFIALGQGQGPLAEQMLETGYQRGHWVLLQNCHLLTSWLKRLEKMLERMKTPHRDFRLWMTTEPSDRFPLGILQRSLKVVTEPPDGLKLNMRSTYSKIDQSMLDEIPHKAFRPCLYVLAFLHAVVLERRKYGKIGWNVKYDFNESDFTISRKLLGLYLTKAWEDEDEFLPWGSLKYLIGDAMYGGRVSDDMDRRVLKTYLEEYMGDFLFDDCQKFYFSRAGFDYELPGMGDLDVYRGMIETLPLTNSPAVFGLHPNAEIGYYTNATKEMWNALISLQPRSSAIGGGMSREEYIANVARDVLSKVPIVSLDIGSYDLLIIRNLLMDKNGGQPPTPCQVVLLQELERWNNLVRKMAASLQDLQRALVGEIGMSDELDGLGNALYNGFLPNMWRRLCPATQKPLGAWMIHFTRRHQQYQTWIEEGEPVVMWLSGLHIPESYLTAMVQTTCRLKNWPLDKSTLYTVVTKYVDPGSLHTKLESGCYINGMYLEGAAWDLRNSCLRRQDPKVLVTELPIMQCIPIEASKLKLQNTFRTPVYVTQDRRNAMGVGLVFEADLATQEHPSHWVLQGVSLCLNIDS